MNLLQDVFESVFENVFEYIFYNNDLIAQKAKLKNDLFCFVVTVWRHQNISLKNILLFSHMLRLRTRVRHRRFINIFWNKKMRLSTFPSSVLTVGSFPIVCLRRRRDKIRTRRISSNCHIHWSVMSCWVNLHTTNTHVSTTSPCF